MQARDLKELGQRSQRVWRRRQSFIPPNHPNENARWQNTRPPYVRCCAQRADQFDPQAGRCWDWKMKCISDGPRVRSRVRRPEGRHRHRGRESASCATRPLAHHRIISANLRRVNQTARTTSRRSFSTELTQCRPLRTPAATLASCR